MSYLRTRSFHATATLAPLPEQLQTLVTAAQRNELTFAAQLAEYRVTNLGDWVLKHAANYATGRHTPRRLRDLWEAYGVWQQRGVNA